MPEKLTTSGAKGAIAWSFEQAGKVKRPMTFYVGVGISLLVLFFLLIIWVPGIDELPRSVAIFTVGAIMIADFYFIFIFRWASKRLDVNPKAFDGE